MANENKLESKTTKQCPHCKSEIPLGAKKCPQCQSDLRNWSSRHPILTVISFLIIFIVIISIMGGNKNTQKVGETSKGNEQTQEIFKIGDKIQRKDAILSVINVNKNWQSANEFDKPSNPDNVFVVVTVSLENQGTSQLSLSGFWDFKLEDVNGVQRSETFGGVGLNKLSSGSITSLSPRGKITGDLIFEVPKTATSELTLHYQPLLDFGEPAKIELQ